MAVLGIDGCPGGWVGAHLRGDVLTWHTGSFRDLLALEADVVAVDIPIGLPAGAERRAADVEARAALGRQRSSVFFAPPRVVLEAVDQPDATRLSRAAGSTGVSIQMFHVLGKVAEVDDALRSDAGAAARVVEVHPEVSFRRLARTEVLPPKRTVAGREARLDVLRRWLPGGSAAVPPARSCAARRLPRRAGLRLDGPAVVPGRGRRPRRRPRRAGRAHAHRRLTGSRDVGATWSGHAEGALRECAEPLLESMSGDVLLSHTVSRAVPSALKGLASGFGMEPGVSLSPWSP